MDEVQKPSNSECYTPSSEPFRIDLHYTVKMYEIGGTCSTNASNDKFKQKLDRKN
jgi:hypothetical protein